MNEIGSIQDKILEIINNNMENIDIKPEQGDYDLSLLGMDSIIFIHIIVVLEEVFDIEVPDEYLLISEMGTLNKIISVVSTTIENLKSDIMRT